MIRRIAISVATMLLAGLCALGLWTFLSRTDGSIGTELHSVALRFSHPWALLLLDRMGA